VKLSVLYLAGSASLGTSESSAVERSDGLMAWLSESDGRLVVEMLFERLLAIDPARVLVIANEEDLRRSRLAAVLSQISDHALVQPMKGPTSGAACTALLAVDHVSAEGELLVLSANEYLNTDYGKIVGGFRASGCDAGVVCFESIHPRYSFARLDDSGRVIEVRQKDPISRNAMAGFYWFRRALDFFEALGGMLRKDAMVDGAFYVAPALNELVLKQMLIDVAYVDASAYHPLKTLRQIETFENRRSMPTHIFASTS